MNFRRSVILVAIICLIVPFAGYGQETFTGVDHVDVDWQEPTEAFNTFEIL